MIPQDRSVGAALRDDAPAVRKIAHLIFAVALAVTAALKFSGVLLFALFSYTVLDLSHRLLRRRMPERAARWAALATFVIVAVALGCSFVVFARLAVVRLPEIVDRVLPAMEAAVRDHGLPLPIEHMREPQAHLLSAVAENAAAVTSMGGVLTRGFFQIVVAIVASLLFFMIPRVRAPPRPDLFDALCREFSELVRRFMDGFELVIGAQVLISAINACLTAVFLIAIGMPYIPFLVLAAFILGLLPIIGNVFSNCIIVGTALTVSLYHAAFALVYLVTIHTFEHFLNSRIIGGSIRAPMWLTLLGIMVGEALLGMPGIVLAPVMIHYVRGELSDIPVNMRNTA